MQRFVQGRTTAPPMIALQAAFGVLRGEIGLALTENNTLSGRNSATYLDTKTGFAGLMKHHFEALQLVQKSLLSDKETSTNQNVMVVVRKNAHLLSLSSVHFLFGTFLPRSNVTLHLVKRPD